MFFPTLRGRWRLAFFLSSVVSGQYIGGQFFTTGLSIISAPQPGSFAHAGSSLNIAISLSGQGNLTGAALAPGAPSSTGTGYDQLSLFMISGPKNVNVSVSDTFLNQETGSNVKHVNFPIPDCLQDGNYNLTLYENSRFRGQPIFAITQVPVGITDAPASGAPCSGNQQVFTQPQATSPLSGSPWLVGQDAVSPVPQGSLAVLASTDPTLHQDVVQPPAQPPAITANPPPFPSDTQTLSTTDSSSSTTTSSSASESTATVTQIQVTTLTGSGTDRILTKTVTITTMVGAETSKSDDQDGILFPVSSAKSLNPTVILLGLPFVFAVLL